jgi:hypothetical protein
MRVCYLDCHEAGQKLSQYIYFSLFLSCDILLK